MARRSKEDALATKQAVLEAAIDIFVEQGVAKSSMEQIARRANVTRGAVYWHFRNKLDIFDELHSRLQDPFMALLNEGLDTGGENPVAELEKVCVSLLRRLVTDSEINKILTVFLLKCDYSGDMQMFLEKQNAQRCESLDIFAQFFRRAKTKDQLPECADPEVVAIALMSYLTGIATEYLRGPEVFDLESRAPCLMKLFFAGFSDKKDV